MTSGVMTSGVLTLNPFSESNFLEKLLHVLKLHETSFFRTVIFFRFYIFSQFSSHFCGKHQFFENIVFVLK